VSVQYYVQISGRAFGPFSSEAIQEAIAQGRIERTTLLSADKRAWEKAGDIPGFFENAAFSTGAGDVGKFQKETFTGTRQSAASETNGVREWFVSVDGRESLGPFATRELFDLFNAGNLSSESLVWRQGDKNSYKIGENKEIQRKFESFRQDAPDPFVNEEPINGKSQNSQTENQRTSATSQESERVAQRGSERLAPKIKTRFLSAWICIGVMASASIVAVILQRRGLATLSFTDFTLGSAVWLLAGLAFVGSVVFGASFIHAFWSTIPKEIARANPNEAVAFLFIPGFRLYWIFQALCGGAVDANKALEKLVNKGKEKESDEKKALFVSPGWALASGVFYDLGGPFNPVSGLFFLLCIGVTTVQMKNVAIELDAIKAARLQTDR